MCVHGCSTMYKTQYYIQADYSVTMDQQTEEMTV